jgi:hypothetical protein
MSFSMDFPYPSADPETRITINSKRGGLADLAVQSYLGTRSLTNEVGHKRSFRVRTRIQRRALDREIVPELLHVLCIEPCQALEPDGAAGWRVVATRPPRSVVWKTPDAFDLVDWAAANGFALAVPFPEYSPILSFPPTTIPGLAGHWIVLDLN